MYRLRLQYPGIDIPNQLTQKSHPAFFNDLHRFRQPARLCLTVSAKSLKTEHVHPQPAIQKVNRKPLVFQSRIISKKRGKIFRKHQTSHETPFLRYHQSFLNKIMHFDFKMDFTKKTKLKLNRRESNRKSKLEKRKKIIWAKKSLSKMRS